MKGALEQLTAISMDKESGREELATLLFDNACILKQNTNTARLCVQIKSHLGQTRLAFTMNWTFNS